MNIKIWNALLMNDRSFELNRISVYLRVHVYCSREYDVLSIISYTVVAYKFFSYTEGVCTLSSQRSHEWWLFKRAKSHQCILIKQCQKILNLVVKIYYKFQVMIE